jgi:hypothetical protein
MTQSNGVPYVADTHQTAIAIAYRNVGLIGQDVCPYSEVAKKTFAYLTFDSMERFTLPDSNVGRKSEPNEVEFKTTELTAKCGDKGLASKVPDEDLTDSKGNYNPLAHHTEALTDLIELGHEVEVAKLFADENNYTNVIDMSKAEFKFLDDPAFDPLPWLLEMLELPLMRPNDMVLSSALGAKLRTNKKLIKGYNGSLGDEGLVPWEYIREQLELDHIRLGKSRLNIAKTGENPKLNYAWQNHFSMNYIDPLAGFSIPRMTFALTARTPEGRISGNRRLAMGVGEGTQVMVGEKTKPVAIAKDCGVLFKNPLRPPE